VSIRGSVFFPLICHIFCHIREAYLVDESFPSGNNDPLIDTNMMKIRRCDEEGPIHELTTKNELAGIVLTLPKFASVLDPR
jgi:hypothetical protein